MNLDKLLQSLSQERFFTHCLTGGVYFLVNYDASNHNFHMVKCGNINNLIIIKFNEFMAHYRTNRLALTEGAKNND